MVRPPAPRQSRRSTAPVRGRGLSKNPTLEDSAYWHGIAGQTVTVTSHKTTGDGVTAETGTATLGRPLLGAIQEDNTDD